MEVHCVHRETNNCINIIDLFFAYYYYYFPQVRRFTRDVVEGLTYLHAQEITHYNIKRLNLLVGSSSESVIIADFGLGRKPSDDVGRIDSLLPKKMDMWNLQIFI